MCQEHSSTQSSQASNSSGRACSLGVFATRARLRQRAASWEPSETRTHSRQQTKNAQFGPPIAGVVGHRRPGTLCVQSCALPAEALRSSMRSFRGASISLTRLSRTRRLRQASQLCSRLKLTLWTLPIAL